MKNEKGILTAPETTDVDWLYQKFQEFSDGASMTRGEFYYFITTPTVERERFLIHIGCTPKVTSEIIHQIYNYELDSITNS